MFGITGFGAALITIPLATHLVPLKFALALFVLADLAAALNVGFENPKNAVRAEWTRLVPMILVGTALGVTLLVNLPRETGMILLGLFVLGFGVFTLLPHARTRIISPAWAWLAGLAGGITSTVFGAGGPPYAIYLTPARADEGAVPRHARLRHPDQHFAAHLRLPAHRAAARSRTCG